MNKASLSFVIVIFASLLVSLNSFAQRQGDRPGERQDERRDTINERVQQTLRLYERLRLSQLLRLSPQEERQLKLISLSIKAQSFQGKAQLELISSGRSLSQAPVNRQLRDIQIQLPQGADLDQLELVASQSEIYIESISLEVQRQRPGQGQGPGPHHPQPQIRQVSAGQLVHLEVHQQVRQMARIDLDELLLRQSGLTLSGAEIERVIVDGDPMGRGRGASVQVELNGRPVGQMKQLASAQRKLPLPIQTSEEVRSGLSLLVYGDAIIESIQIRIGQVRPQFPQGPQSQRIMVNQEISSYRDLELGQLLPYESRLVSSIILDARSNYSDAQVAASSFYGGILGSVIVRQVPMRAEIRLMQAVSVRELRLQSLSPVRIDSVELVFASGRPY